MNGDEELLNELERVASEGAERISRTGRPKGDELDRHREEPLTVTINSPHTVDVHGRAVAINIKSDSDAPRGTGALGPIVLTLSKNGIPTDYNVNAEEA